jgi:hypothetical protein
MRIVSIIAAGTLACGLAMAAGRAENITYVDGNLFGIKPQSSGALVYASPDVLRLTYGAATFPVPYAGISKAGLSAPQQRSSDVALYKIWELHKHFVKIETQFLTIDFKDAQGESRNMTLELGKSAASTVLNAIKLHNPSVEVTTLDSATLAAIIRDSSHEHSNAEPTSAGTPAATPAKEGWWGDSYWKTGRNAERWEKSTANAPE